MAKVVALAVQIWTLTVIIGLLYYSIYMVKTLEQMREHIQSVDELMQYQTQEILRGG